MPFNQPLHIICQAVFTRTSQDPVINTFYFRRASATTYPAARTMIRNRLDKFYTGLHTTQVKSLREYMSAQLVALEYRMGEVGAAPGTPYDVVGSNWTTPTDTLRMPPETAICISYRALPPNTARRRGRLFIGPLNTSVLFTTNGGVTDQCQSDFANAALGLAVVSGSDAVDWMIASRKYNESAKIERGYVNADFDRQERRAHESQQTDRHTWSTGV